VIFGFEVFGAMMGVVFGVIAGLVYSFYFNKDILQVKDEKVKFDNIYSLSVPYFIAMLVIFLTVGLDILLAKKFFSPELAGQYAVLSMMGKMIFFGTFAVGKAMFPLTSETHDNNQDSSKLFKRSIFMILGLSIAGILVYLLVPELVVSIFYGPQYLEIADYLVYSGIAMGLLSLSNLNFVYGLSTNRLKKSYLLFIFIIIEIVILSLFHSTIQEYILAFMVSNAIMFIGSLFFIRK
jgi:O-antigen/teichoic acid export membrane protein